MNSRTFAFLLASAASLYAQAGRGNPPATAKTSAPADLAGYWVSVVTEDWRYRMLTPRKGDYNSVPLNAAARKIADAWDPAKDEASGDQCKAYGAAALMRRPGRLHVTWQDDNTLKVEMDDGQQTRLLHFGAKAAATPPSWQGTSAAQVLGLGAPLLGAGGAAVAGPPVNRRPNLKVVTTNMRPGYLRKNGVPYSADASLTEFIDVIQEAPGATEWLIVTSTVDDPQFLTVPFVTSTHFKKEADGAKWDPQPCTAR